MKMRLRLFVMIYAVFEQRLGNEMTENLANRKELCRYSCARQAISFNSRQFPPVFSLAKATLRCATIELHYQNVSR